MPARDAKGRMARKPAVQRSNMECELAQPLSVD
jgi:hypothetical protein